MIIINNYLCIKAEEITIGTLLEYICDILIPINKIVSITGIIDRGEAYRKHRYGINIYIDPKDNPFEVGYNTKKEANVNFDIFIKNKE